jgi:hypothetical protein
MAASRFPGFENIYVLSDPLDERAFRSGHSRTSDATALLRGDAIASDCVELHWEMGGNDPRDVIWTTAANAIIVSDRVASIFATGANYWMAYVSCDRHLEGW